MGASEASFGTAPESRHRVRICFDGVTFQRGKRTILENVSGLVEGGRLTALISGDGGRGDYHLMSVLAAQHECQGGLTIVNGTLARSPDYQRHCALIDDELTVLDHLTVVQNLMYGSEMRQNVAGSEHAARLEVVAGWFKLESVLKKSLTSCSHYIRRRVSIAREVMLHPAAVFVDSAVEGLATHEARELLTLLREVALRTGCVLAVSLLQPRWTLVELVDDVILLEGNSIAFRGTSTELIHIASAFSAHSQRPLLHVPQGSENGGGAPRGPTEDTAPTGAAVPSYGTMTGAAIATRGGNEPVEAPETCLNSLYRIASNPNTALVATIPVLAERQLRQGAEVQDVVTQFVEGQLPLLQTPYDRQPPRVPVTFLLLCKYGLLQLWNRKVQASVGALLLLLGAILVGVVYQNQKQDGQVGMQNRVGIIFFLISSTFLHNLVFVEATKRAYLSFQRHRLHGYYGAFTYLLYWQFTSLLQRFVGCLMFTGVVYLLANLRSVAGHLDLTSLHALVIIMALTSFAASTLVWLVCSLVPTARYAHFALFTIYAFSTILAGVVLNVDTLPSTFQQASYGSFIRLGYESAVASEFHNRSFGCDQFVGSALQHTTAERDPETVPSSQQHAGVNATLVPSAASSTRCFTGDSYMHFLGFHADRQWSNMALLVYLTLGLITASFVVMIVDRSR